MSSSAPDSLLPLSLPETEIRNTVADGPDMQREHELYQDNRQHDPFSL